MSVTETPLDVWLNITKYLTWKDRTRLSLTSPYFHHLYHQETLWKNVEIMHPESTNYCSEILQANASSLKYIRSFTMRRAKQTGKSLEILKDLTTDLRVLDLSNSQNIYKQRLQLFLQQQTQLEVLNLANCEYSFVTTDPFPFLTNLTSLNLSALNNTTNENMASIGKNLSKLKSLTLAGSWNLTEERFNVLATSLTTESLEYLDLRACSAFTNKNLEQLAPKLTNLEYLDLSMTNIGGDIAMNLIGKYCTKLKTLVLRERSITDAGFIDGITKLKDLIHLDITSSKELTNDSLVALKACTALTDLNISFNENFSHIGLEPLLECLNLKYLDVSQVDITDNTLDLIANHSPNIIRLNLQYCKNISDDGVERIVKQCSRLVKLDIGFCDQLGDQSMAAVLAYSSSIRNLNMEHCTKLTNQCLNGLELWLNRHAINGIHSKINITSHQYNIDLDLLFQIRKKYEGKFNLIFKKPKPNN